MKITKIIALLLALMVCLSLVSCKRREGEESRGLEMTLSENGSYYTVTGIGKCKDYDILIPREYKGLPVMAIGERAFKGENITRITLTENVLYIADRAFEGCNSIVYNELEGLYYLGTEKNPAYALVCANENSKGTFTIHKETKILADSALYDCDITSLSLPEGITHIGKAALYSCDKLENIALPETLRSIGDEAFGNCGALATITLPQNLALLGSDVFMYCSKLTKINFSGTSAAWEAIEKSPKWDRDMEEYTLVFTEN